MNKARFSMLLACLLFLNGFPLFGQVNDPGFASVSPQLEAKAKQVLVALKNRNGAALAGYVDPERGLRFLPNLWDEFDTNLILPPKDVALLYRSPKVRQWGVYDGSGDPIRMKGGPFMRRFVWNTDYTKVQEVEWSGFSAFLNSSGRVLDPDTKEKILAIFPQAQVVTYFFPGITAPQGGAMDWSWLVLIWVPRGDQWFLAGIGHHEWKI